MCAVLSMGRARTMCIVNYILLTSLVVCIVAGVRLRLYTKQIDKAIKYSIEIVPRTHNIVCAVRCTSHKQCRSPKCAT